MTHVRAYLTNATSAEQRPITGVLPPGAMVGVSSPTRATWRTEGPSLAGGKLSFQVTASTRRLLIVIAAASHTWATKYSGRSFDWAGGVPPEPIDLETLVEGPFQAADAYKDETRGLTVLTDVLDAGTYEIDNLAGFNAFVDGEEEVDLGVWPGGSSATPETVGTEVNP